MRFAAHDATKKILPLPVARFTTKSIAHPHLAVALHSSSRDEVRIMNMRITALVLDD